MKKNIFAAIILVIFTSALANGQANVRFDNPSIDMDGYLKAATKAAKYRESRRLSEAEFIKMAAEKGTVVLDARSREKYDELHIKDAVNLSFSDITVASLNTLLPNKNTRILIYCNNNFRGNESAFPTKIAAASLNLSTYISLYTYGYRNVYELGPLLDVKTTRLTLLSSEVND
ncbi:MAG TPA: rhodanese-like domain-containing protein [Pyrinomonadaceae bacterium]|nr:rhodanese-like domain-containing protein [Pyrinomonadaceae bacterium]